MAMSIKKLEEKNDLTSYLVKGTSTAFINAVRRSIMLHAKCLAIENISIYENDSVMFDEFLAHRLGLLPIKTDKSFKEGDSVKLVLEKEGPGTVYSKDIKSTDPKIEVMDKNIPITRLTKGQRLKLEMQAVMHSGKEHAKWQPAVVSFKEVPFLEVSRDCNGCNECAKQCPADILNVKGKKVILTDAYKCNLCGACVDACSKEALKLGFDSNSFVFSIEPIAGLTAKETMTAAVKELLEKSKQFSKALAKAK